MATTPFRLPAERNEANFEYRKGSPERKAVEDALQRLRSQLPVKSDIVINGQVQRPSSSLNQVLPSEHGIVFSNYPLASKEQVREAIESALEAKKKWENTPFVDRAAIFLRAAELVTGKYRHELIAATMLGQGKNVWQAEIDAAAELADFFRLNCNYAAELLGRQPTRGTDGIWTRVEYRPLEGFVYAVSPFDFTALGGSLVSGPALMGNVVLWKPSPHSIYASSLVYKILKEAGLPKGVVQFVPGDAQEVTDEVLAHREFAGLNFVGSSDVFRSIYGRIGQGIANKTYREFPRVVGETSGKNFHLVHPSADIASAVSHTIRGAFEYQGQKCSATSRVYLPASRAEEFISGLKAGVEKITIGSPEKDFEAFMGPVIHRASFDKIKSIIDAGNGDKSLKLLVGGKYDDSVGFFVKPTVYQADAPDHPLFNQEIFGPVLVLYVYPDAEWTSVLKKVDQSGGGLALTGAVFGTDREALRQAEDTLRYSAGNFYINCKTTAALIGQQTFGGARSSGTNDKAGSSDILRRFTSPRTLKEEFFPLDRFTYPSNEDESKPNPSLIAAGPTSSSFASESPTRLAITPDLCKFTRRYYSDERSNRINMAISKSDPILIAGAGAFGLSTALRLSRAGYTNITVLDKSKQIPSGYSAANDINKILRAEYEDPFYTDLAVEALEAWKTPLFAPHFHQTGFLHCASATAPEKAVGTLNAFRASAEAHPRMKKHVSPINSKRDIVEQFWQFRNGPLTGWHGYFNSYDGYAHSSNSLIAVHRACVADGVRFLLGREAAEIVYEKTPGGSTKATGVRTRAGAYHAAKLVIVALGATATDLVPQVGQQVVAKSWSVAHVQLTDAEASVLRGIPVTYARDLGFLFEPEPGTNLLKLCPMGGGSINTDPKTGVSRPPATLADSAFLPAEDEKRIRKLLAHTLPSLADRPLINRSLCWFADTIDSDFIVDYVPETSSSVILLSGDSGHGFKMFPIVGDWVKALLEAKDGKQPVARWRWKNRDSKDGKANWGASVSWRVGNTLEFEEVRPQPKSRL
ncbi:hypothetical protein DL769_000287 [Monosporascus sp. CRB-8-3]|nr:hypothetical protein DL769_000287 [Monosporascus sp. CRB-8-3]